MFRFAQTFVVLSLIALAGCTQQNAPVASTMNREAATGSPQQEQLLMEQAAALTEMSEDLVRKTTWKGAAIGAVAGCGLAAIGGSKIQCAQAALVGGVIGSVAGHARGTAEVEKRVELVSLSRVLPSLNAANAQMAVVQQDLPAVLEAQDAEIARLRSDLETGTISQEDHDRRLDEVRIMRSNLAEAFSLSAKQARQARLTLEDAKAQGQTGADWYLIETGKLEQDATSARASISLL